MNRIKNGRKQQPCPLFTSGLLSSPWCLLLCEMVFIGLYFSLSCESTFCAPHHKVLSAFLLALLLCPAATKYMRFTKSQPGMKIKIMLQLGIILTVVVLPLLLLHNIDIVLIYNIRRYWVVSKENSYF